jgi:hypothetical protein
VALRQQFNFGWAANAKLVQMLLQRFKMGKITAGAQGLAAGKALSNCSLAH